MNLELCSKCDAGVAEYNKHNNCFYCNSCGVSAPNSYGGTIEDAAKAWNDCNTPTRTMADVMAENEELRADILKTVIESGEVLKHHTSLMAHIERLHYSLCDLSNLCDGGSGDEPRAIIAAAKEATSQTPAQSLNLVEAAAVRKAAGILCTSIAGKVLVSHTKLNNYADRLEKQV